MDGASSALGGYRVVALEQAVAAPLCTRHLADLGADVIKVERPDGGDFARRYDSVVNGESAYFVWLNRGKRSAAVDLVSESGRRFFDALLGSADIFVHNLGPGAVDRLGYSWDAVHARWPALVVCSITGFGRTGPFRENKAFDLLVQGETGLASVTGSPNEPAKVGISIADIGAGMYALAAILASIIERRETGSGTFVEISMFDGLAEWMSVPALYQRHTGAPPPRTGLHHATIAPYGPYRSGDGPDVLVAVQNERQWTSFCDVVLESPGMKSDQRFMTNERRVRNRRVMDLEINRRLAEVDHATLLHRLQAGDIPYGTLNDVEGLISHPQITERGRWIETATPSGPTFTIASPIGSGPGRRSVPALGADTHDLEQELGLRP